MTSGRRGWGSRRPSARGRRRTPCWAPRATSTRTTSARAWSPRRATCTASASCSWSSSRGWRPSARRKAGSSPPSSRRGSGPAATRAGWSTRGSAPPTTPPRPPRWRRSQRPASARTPASGRPWPTWCAPWSRARRDPSPPWGGDRTATGRCESPRAKGEVVASTEALRSGLPSC